MLKNNGFLEYVNCYHIKNFIVYHKTSEKLYKRLKMFSIIAYVYQLVVNIILILGLKLAKQPLESNIITNTIVATVFLVLAFILHMLKYGIPAFLLNIISVIFEMSLMVPGLIKTAGAINIKGAFYWQYAIPMTVILVLTSIMGFIAAKERYIIRRDTKLLDNAIYEKFGKSYSELTDKQIREFINTFNPFKDKKD